MIVARYHLRDDAGEVTLSLRWGAILVGALVTDEGALNLIVAEDATREPVSRTFVVAEVGAPVAGTIVSAVGFVCGNFGHTQLAVFEVLP